MDNNILKLFISYSHEDENYIHLFRKHLSPLKSNGLIKDWHDRKIIAGQDFQDTIDNNLQDADVICLCISANFLSSNPCMTEKEKAFDLKRKKGISVVTIILSDCGWLDDKELSKHLALPTDGKSVSSYPDQNTGWKDVYDGLKKTIEQEVKIKNIQISEPFVDYLNDSGLLSKAHPKKAKVLLDDIFVYPELIKYDDIGDVEKKINSEMIIDEFADRSKLLLAGENQSGKTTLCKKLYKELRARNFVPIYVSDKNSQYEGLIENRIENSFKEQYINLSFKDINKERIVPIIDDFHFALKKENRILELAAYRYQILIVDEVFSLNFQDEKLTKNYTQYKVKQFSPSLRNDLIKKWVCLDENKVNPCLENSIYKSLDDATELINSTLGKIISSGIMPAYPFFILSVLSTYETFEKPLDQEITSQGYCYQALIYMYLRKQGVKNDEIDTYINFLSVIAYHFFSDKKAELTQGGLDEFMITYNNKYNLPVKKEVLLQNLQITRMLPVDSFGNYYFYYPYLYYYFVAKYLAEHLDDNKGVVDTIIGNLHKDENAYIAVFMSHHSKNNYILDEILLNSWCLFDKYQPATLTKQDLLFFDDKLDSIVNAMLPSNNSTPEMERKKKLQKQDLMEEAEEGRKKQTGNKSKTEEAEDELARELRRSIKTVEVMGSIVKNRSGSLERGKLEIIFKDAMNVYLRILSSFFEFIKDEKQQAELIDFITSKLNFIIQEKSKKLSDEKLQKIARKIFWNLNFSIVYGFINMIIGSLGSDKLQEIISKICDDSNTPATILVKHGSLMSYSKNLQIDNIADAIDSDGFSETAKKIMKFMIVNHCSLHKISFKDKQKIEYKLDISSKQLLREEYTHSKK